MIYIITGPQRFSMRRYIDKIADIANLPHPARTMPVGMVRADCARAELGYRPEFDLARGEPSLREYISNLSVGGLDSRAQVD